MNHGSTSYLKHLLVYMCERLAGHQVGVALAQRLPRDGGLSLSLLRHLCLVTNCGPDGKFELQDRPPAPLCIGKGHKDQGLTKLPVGRQWVPIKPAVVSIVVVFCVLHMLALINKHILAIGAHYLRHIQPVINISRAGGQRQGEQGVWVWAGETGLRKQADWTRGTLGRAAVTYLSQQEARDMQHCMSCGSITHKGYFEWHFLRHSK